mmetsp:Transcript_119859/g.219499  ORF Transcript_119859/g.219499 Transcript_119859/m.219499 type:complete len:323 (-) Transcript_119859:4-972(-)
MCAEVCKPPSPPRQQVRTWSGSSLRSAGALALEPGSPTAASPATAVEPMSPTSPNSRRLSKVKFSESGAGGVDKAAIRDKQENGTSPKGSENSSLKLKGFFAKRDRSAASAPETQSARLRSPPNANEMEGLRMGKVFTAPPQAGGRRRSLPCLKVSTRAEKTSDAPPRRVSFGGGSPELFEAFTPYCKKYGAHPADFYFDSEGHMVLEEEVDSDDDEGGLGKVKVGDTLECIVDCGVGYRKKPQMTARFDDLRTLEVEQQIKVLQRCGGWIRDSVGWLPLTIKSTPVFEIVVPKEKLKYATPRVAVSVLSCARDDEDEKRGG